MVTIPLNSFLHHNPAITAMSQSVASESHIMEANIQGHEIFLSMAMWNVAELILSQCVGFVYLDWSMVGTIAYIGALISVSVTSIWIFATYGAGTNIEQSDTSALGIPLGPDEQSIDNFYGSAEFMKWFMWTVYWIIPALFTADIWVTQPATATKSIVNLWFYPQENSD